jgi:hypothetical protein
MPTATNAYHSQPVPKETDDAKQDYDVFGLPKPQEGTATLLCSAISSLSFHQTNKKT